MPDGVENRAEICAAGAGRRALLAAEGLAFEAGGARLVDGVSLAIAEGRRTVILGPNGAGKSLLLRLLHGLIAPTAGRVLWRGGPLDAAARRAQAMVFQRPVLLRRSVRANLAFALSVRGVARAERRRRIEEALATARLERLADRPARLLSGGEQQRLAIVRALACRPELLFLDEPSSSLDPASTLAIERLVEAAHARGVTIVLVTHDRAQARRLGQDAAVLDRGRLVEAGPAEEILTAPRTEAARAWLEGRLRVGPDETP